jgi:hypothetical protein
VGAAALAVIVVLSLVACGDGNRGTREEKAALRRNAEVWFLVPDAPDAVARVAVDDAEGRHVEVIRAGAMWQPGRGAERVTASMMLESEGQMLPLGAYKRLEVDSFDPLFGLARPSMEVTVEGRDQTKRRIRFGAKNFNGAGYYVTVDDDPVVYLVPRRAGDDFRSLALGIRIDTPRDPRETEGVENYHRNEEPDDVTNPWLRQALELEPSDAEMIGDGAE